MNDETPPITVRPMESRTLGQAVEHDQVMGIRVVATTPIAWQTRGLVLAVRRFRTAAAKPQETARDVAIPLFEVLNWAVAIDEYLQKRSRPTDPSLAALRFVRNRTHHQAASAIQFDRSSNEWVWRPAANLPLAPKKHEDQEGEREYAASLALCPVVEALNAAAAFVRSLA